MTADAVAIDPIPVSSPPTQRSGVAATVKLIKESWAEVEPETAEVAKFFYAMLFSLDPGTRDLFPANMDVQRSRLMRAIIHFVQMIDRPDDLSPFLRQLGRDHRKFGVVNKHYESVGTALLAAVKRFCGESWTPQVERAWAEGYTLMARTMQEAAATDQGPAFWPATVVEYERVNLDLAVIRVQPDYPTPYEAGQYMSVEVPQRPRMWRYLTPANAPREDGSIEFQIRAVQGGWVSRGMAAHSNVGDTWKIGPPLGRMSVDRQAGRDVLMVAGGTGITTMESILDELAQWGENPRVHLFYGGRTRDDLYGLEDLQQLAAGNPWLTVVPVLESEPNSTGFEHGTLADVVTRYGAWADRDVLVAGSPAMIRATVSRMLVAGTPLDRIRYDPFTID